MVLDFYGACMPYWVYFITRTATVSQGFEASNLEALLVYATRYSPNPIMTALDRRREISVPGHRGPRNQPANGIRAGAAQFPAQAVQLYHHGSWHFYGNRFGQFSLNFRHDRPPFACRGQKKTRVVGAGLG